MYRQNQGQIRRHLRYLRAVLQSRRQAISPYTGHHNRLSRQNNLYSVTIISDSSCDGDALSTTCFALGIDKAKELINSLSGVEAIFVTDDYSIITTSDEYNVSTE